VREIRLKWNEKVVHVPKALHINLLNLSLTGNFGRKTIQFLPNSAGDALLVQATGGDGGASYLGKHQQFYHGYWEDDLPTEIEAWKLVRAEQDGTDQPATALESKPEGRQKLEPEAEGYSL